MCTVQYCIIKLLLHSIHGRLRFYWWNGIPNLPPAGEVSTHPTGCSNSDCLTMCLSSCFFWLCLVSSFTSVNSRSFSMKAMSENYLSQKQSLSNALYCLFFCILPPLQQKFFPCEAVSDQFYTTWFYSCFLVYSRNLAQNRTLFCLLVFTAVYLDSLEDDDKIRTGVQAGSPWKSALRRRSNRYTQEALFPETKQLDRSLEGGLHLSLQEPLCVLKDLAPPENYMSASSKSHNLTFSVILPLRFKSNLLA